MPKALVTEAQVGIQKAAVELEGVRTPTKPEGRRDKAKPEECRQGQADERPRRSRRDEGSLRSWWTDATDRGTTSVTRRGQTDSPGQIDGSSISFVVVNRQTVQTGYISIEVY